MEGLLKLEEVVDQLRLELKLLQKKAAQDNESLRFEVESAQVELNVVVTKTKDISGGVKVNFWLAEVGVEGGGSWSKAETQTIRLTLKPRPLKDGQPTGGTTLIGADDDDE